MNEWGIEGCDRNRATITEWLATETQIDGLPIHGRAAQRLISLAIQKAEAANDGKPRRDDTVRTPGWERQDRLRACSECEHYRETCDQFASHDDFLAAIDTTVGTCPCGRWQQREVRMIFTADLAVAAAAMTWRLPSDAAAVVAVPRSGLLPAGIVAGRLHVPVFGVSGDRLVPLDGGQRTLETLRREGRTIWIDDTVGRGWQIKRLRSLDVVKPDDFFAAVYSTEECGHLVDYFFEQLESPHILEWNFFCGPAVVWAALDLDGVICRDGRLEDYQEPRLWEFLRDVEPLHVPRNRHFRPHIVTARPEAWRDATIEWLGRQGAYWRELVMWPGDPADRNLESVARWKVQECRRLDMDFYVESDARLAHQMRTYHYRVLSLTDGVLR